MPRGRADGVSGGWRVKARSGRCGPCCGRSGQPEGGAVLEPIHEGASWNDCIVYWVLAGLDRLAEVSANEKKGHSRIGRYALDQRRRERTQRSLRQMGAERRCRCSESSGRSCTGPRQERVARAR